jgi:hypothetical protein
MTDTQMVTLAAAFLAAIIAVLFNNSRIGDARTDLGSRFAATDKRIDDLRDRLNERIDAVNTHIDDKFKLLDQKIESKFQLIDQKLDHIIELVASPDNRIQTLEGKK